MAMSAILLFWITSFSLSYSTHLPVISDRSAQSVIEQQTDFPPPMKLFFRLPPIAPLVEDVALAGSRNSNVSDPSYFTDYPASFWPNHLRTFYVCFPDGSDIRLRKSLVCFINNRFGEMLIENQNFWLLIKSLIKIAPFTMSSHHRDSFVNSRHRLLLLRSYASTTGIFTYDEVLQTLLKSDGVINFEALKRYKIFFRFMSLFDHQIDLAKCVWNGIFALGKDRLKYISSILSDGTLACPEIIQAILTEAFQSKPDWDIAHLCGFLRGYSVAMAERARGKPKPPRKYGREF